MDCIELDFRNEETECWLTANMSDMTYHVNDSKMYRYEREVPAIYTNESMASIAYKLYTSGFSAI